MPVLRYTLLIDLIKQRLSYQVHSRNLLKLISKEVQSFQKIIRSLTQRDNLKFNWIILKARCLFSRMMKISLTRFFKLNKNHFKGIKILRNPKLLNWIYRQIKKFLKSVQIDQSSILVLENIEIPKIDQ